MSPGPKLKKWGCSCPKIQKGAKPPGPKLKKNILNVELKKLRYGRISPVTSPIATTQYKPQADRRTTLWWVRARMWTTWFLFYFFNFSFWVRGLCRVLDFPFFLIFEFVLGVFAHFWILGQLHPPLFEFWARGHCPLMDSSRGCTTCEIPGFCRDWLPFSLFWVVAQCR